MNPRLILKNVLARLAKRAIKKHKMELVVILGLNGTEIIKELTYSILAPNHKVRRVINKPWWDLSIPLSILGYKDKKRNPFQWMYLIIKSYLYLFFGPKNSGILILNMNYSHTDTMNFWAKFINPDILILANYKNSTPEIDKFIQNTRDNKGKIIIKEGSKINTDSKTFVVGQSRHNNLQTINTATELKLVYKKEKQTVPRSALTLLPTEAFELAIALGLLYNMTLEETTYYSLKFDLPAVLSKIKNNLYKGEY